MTWEEASALAGKGKVVCRTGKPGMKYRRKDGVLYVRSNNNIMGGWRVLGVMWKEDTQAVDWFVDTSVVVRERKTLCLKPKS